MVFKNPETPEENARGKSLCLKIFSYSVVEFDYKWSEDNSSEIEKGWIVKAGTVSELSKLLKLDEVALQLSIGKDNHFCRSGVDSDFGRDASTLKAIAPPYYAMQFMPLLCNTRCILSIAIIVRLQLGVPLGQSHPTIA